MKRLFVVAVAVSALLLPTLTFAQGVKTVYRPEVHGTIIVVPEASVTPETRVANVAKAERTKPLAAVIARHEAMANAYRNLTRAFAIARSQCAIAE